MRCSSYARIWCSTFRMPASTPMCQLRCNMMSTLSSMKVTSPITWLSLRSTSRAWSLTRPTRRATPMPQSRLYHSPRWQTKTGWQERWTSMLPMISPCTHRTIRRKKSLHPTSISYTNVSKKKSRGILSKVTGKTIKNNSKPCGTTENTVTRITHRQLNFKRSIRQKLSSLKVTMHKN